jgi:hypothetical protein
MSGIKATDSIFTKYGKIYENARSPNFHFSFARFASPHAERLLVDHQGESSASSECMKYKLPLGQEYEHEVTIWLY